MDRDAATSGGDAACWLHLVCDECGAVVTSRDGHRPDCRSRTPTTSCEVSARTLKSISQAARSRIRGIAATEASTEAPDRVS
jgi:hypothetical protein